MNVQENTGDDANNKDKEVIENIMKKIIPDEEVKIDQITRIGKKKENNSRLIRIKVQNSDIKRRILQNSNKVNEGTEIIDPKKKIYINPDYTKKESELQKTLRDKLRAMPTEERAKYTIKFNRIIPRDETTKVKQ